MPDIEMDEVWQDFMATGPEARRAAFDLAMEQFIEAALKELAPPPPPSRNAMRKVLDVCGFLPLLICAVAAGFWPAWCVLLLAAGLCGVGALALAFTNRLLGGRMT